MADHSAPHDGLDPDEPSTPLWLTALGGALFLGAAVFFVATDDGEPDALRAAAASAATPAPAPTPAAAAEAPAQPTRPAPRALPDQMPGAGPARPDGAPQPRVATPRPLRPTPAPEPAH